MTFKKIALAALFAFSAGAQASVLIDVDFRDYSAGTGFDTQIEGVTFKVEGGPGASGTPVTDGYSFGLSNSVTGDWPTGAILDLKFNGVADDINFTFANFPIGQDRPNETFYTAYDALGNVLATGGLAAGGGGFYALAVSGVADLQFNNNTGGLSNWLFDVQTLHANVSSATAVPEPASLALFGLGGLCVLARRRRR